MNKTLIIAACDFLILSTLSLMTFTPVDETAHTDSELIESTDFVVTDDNPAEFDILYVQHQLQESQSKHQQSNKKIHRLEEEINLLTEEKDKLNQTRGQLAAANQQLRTQLEKFKMTPYSAISQTLQQISITMSEYDTISSDSFNNRFYSCVIDFGDRQFIPAAFSQLGFNWSEIIKDGHIDDLSLISATTGMNPRSSNHRDHLFSINSEAQFCLIPVKQKKNALKVFDAKQINDYLESLYALKANGRIIRISQASLIPGQKNAIEVTEERFLGAPDKLAIGDLLVTSTGEFAGMVTSQQTSGNSLRHKISLVSELELGDKTAITLKKDSEYFEQFVNTARKINNSIRP